LRKVTKGIEMSYITNQAKTIRAFVSFLLELAVLMCIAMGSLAYILLGTAVGLKQPFYMGIPPESKIDVPNEPWVGVLLTVVGILGFIYIARLAYQGVKQIVIKAKRRSETL